MKKLVLGALVSVLLLAASSQGADREPPLQTRPLPPEFAKGRDLVLPSPGERSYRTIAWRPSVLRGLVDAQKADRPLMIVLMNGHPLGCT
jgi:hypothetical protein